MIETVSIGEPFVADFKGDAFKDKLGLLEKADGGTVFLDKIEGDTLQLALDENEGNRRLAAEQLGASQKTVYNLIKPHGL
jgi:transcriptional regulator with AAA-type ATPase domain